MLENFLNLIIFTCVILCATYYFTHINAAEEENDGKNSEPSSPSQSWLPVLGEKFAAAFNVESDTADENEVAFFPPCDDENTISAFPDHRCLSLPMDVFDIHTGNMLHRVGDRRLALPNTETIPRSCGFGLLFFDRDTQQWECRCKAPDYFWGEFCDQPHFKLTRENKCSKVADARDVDNLNIATFNPVLGGVCVECSVPGAVPILDSSEPRCEEMNVDLDESIVPLVDDLCFYDALNPHANNSPNNKFVEGYGCSCDYHNGFVEVFVPGIAIDTEERGGGRLISNACIKVGVTSDFHMADVAYYCLKNQLNPIQVHSYSRVESPFDFVFEGNEILVLQPAASITDKNDWLNRNVKPISTQPIRRLNYPVDDWPIVNKLKLINHYKRRKETFPVSAYKLNVGRGFETKHWYETTNKRWLSNTIWGHPIVYSIYGQNAWRGKSTLNPVGVREGWYYGITMKTKPGEVVRMDTRGYNKAGKVVTIPPSIRRDMLEMNNDTPFLWYLYLTYSFRH